jgi:transposase
MNEQMRNEIIRRHQGGASMRVIARSLGIARKTVRRVLDRQEQDRVEGPRHPELPQPRQRRASSLDAHEDSMRELLGRYPDITAVRMLEELRARGFAGQYTIVLQRLRELRPAPGREPVLRFETAPGAQAQMDYGSYELDFTQEGRRRVNLFSYVLGYSRRQYLRFVESQDFETTVREHIRAFEYLGGAAATCLYDNMKVVVSRYEDDEPIYNPRFLAFATHYGFRPWACRRRRPQTKGYASHCTSWVGFDANRRLSDSLRPCHLSGGLSPGCSYRNSLLSL